jgi:polyisoprenoid-binding protein YceI
MFRSTLTAAVAAAAIALPAAVAAPASAAETYAFDKTHTDVVFEVSHFGFSNTIGRFNEVDGSIVLDEENPENSSVEVTIQADSIDTNHAARDEHLRSPDFFDVANHPTITFTSTSVERTGENTAKVTGDFTLLGVTKPVVLEVTLNALKPHPIPQMDGVMTAGFSASTTITRTDFGMDTYAPAIGVEIPITLEVEALQQ